MANGEDTRDHPGRKVGRNDLQHPHTVQAQGVPAGSHWTEGFVGEVAGFDNRKTFFDAKATGGGSTDSLPVDWQSDKSHVGKTLAMLPQTNGNGPAATTSWHAMDLDALHPEDRKKYSHLPGYR